MCQELSKRTLLSLKVPQSWCSRGDADGRRHAVFPKRDMGRGRGNRGKVKIGADTKKE